MGNPSWKWLSGSRPYRAAKLFLKRASGEELWLRREAHVDTVAHGGWRVDPKGLGPTSIVYSVGIGNDIDFDVGLIEQFGCEVHAFDPTPYTARWLATRIPPLRFYHHPWAIAGHDGSMTLYPRVRKDGTLSEVMYTQEAEKAARGYGVEVPVLTITSAMQRLGHHHIDLLKLDVEGAEYDVLDTLPVAPRQLLIEFHHRFRSISINQTRRAIRRLRMDGYRIVAVADSGREVSFLKMPPRTRPKRRFTPAWD